MSVGRRRRLAAFIVTLVCLGGGVRGADTEYPFQALNEAFASLGFSSSAEDAAYFVACTDAHITMGKSEEFPAYIIDDINLMQPPPVFLVVTGDMITDASSSFGQVPGAEQKKKALAEFEILRRDLSRLHEGIPVHFAAGNHDTYPGDVELSLLRTVFPSIPPYHSESLAGVALFFLNGGSSGGFDSAQLHWLNETAAALPRNREVILFVHQPSLGSVVTERGIREGICGVFAQHEGRMWLFAGHHHHNADAVFALPKTTIAQCGMTTCSPNVWGDANRPGYWVYCLRGGQVVGRVFRRNGSGYRVVPLPAREKPASLPIPFAGLNVSWKLMIGEGDRPFLRHAKAADVVSWWTYIRELVYELPLDGLSAPPAQLAVLASLSHDQTDLGKRGHLFLSPDGKTWEEVELPAPKGGCYLIPLSETQRKGNALQVKITFDRAGGSLGGFALCGDPLEKK